MRNTEKVRRSAAPNLLVQFPLAELTLQLAVDPSKSRRSITARADGRSQQKPTVDPSKSRRQESSTVDPSKSRRQEPMVDPNSRAATAGAGHVHQGFLVECLLDVQVEPRTLDVISYYLKYNDLLAFIIICIT
jgi:hypothetical protein